jgi:hypothetical protein
MRPAGLHTDCQTLSPCLLVPDTCHISINNELHPGKDAQRRPVTSLLDLMWNVEWNTNKCMENWDKWNVSNARHQCFQNVMESYREALKHNTSHLTSVTDRQQTQGDKLFTLETQFGRLQEWNTMEDEAKTFDRVMIQLLKNQNEILLERLDNLEMESRKMAKRIVILEECSQRQSKQLDDLTKTGETFHLDGWTYPSLSGSESEDPPDLTGIY